MKRFIIENAKFIIIKTILREDALGTLGKYKTITKKTITISKNIFLNPVAFIKLFVYTSRNKHINSKLLAYISSIFQYGRFSPILDKKTQVNLFVAHNSFLKEKFNTFFCNNCELTVWKFSFSDLTTVYIKLHLPIPGHSHEGDLCFSLFCNDVLLLTISGNVQYKENNDLSFFYLSRIQGSIGRYNEIKFVNKNFYDLNSTHLLLAAVEGFCLYFNISKILAVSSKIHFAYNENKKNLLSTYDSFFEKRYGKLNENSMFELSVPLLKNTTNDDIKKHRSRHKKHDQTRRLVSSQVYDYLKMKN